MAKLVVLSEGMTGQSYELKVDKTTVGRVDDNTFQISHPSISSHHCEILLRGDDVVIKDLNSTNGTFIAGQQITTEGVLKPGQLLRLGQVDLRLESGEAAVSSVSKKPVDSTMVISKGVSFDQLQQGPKGLETSTGIFTKKKNTTSKYFIIGGILLGLVILIAFLVVLSNLSNAKHP